MLSYSEGKITFSSLATCFPFFLAWKTAERLNWRNSATSVKVKPRLFVAHQQNNDRALLVVESLFFSWIELLSMWNISDMVSRRRSKLHPDCLCRSFWVSLSSASKRTWRTKSLSPSILSSPLVPSVCHLWFLLTYWSWSSILIHGFLSHLMGDGFLFANGYYKPLPHHPLSVFSPSMNI